MPPLERYVLHSRMSGAPKITLLVSERLKSLGTNNRSKLRYNGGEGHRRLVEAPPIVDGEPSRIKSLEDISAMSEMIERCTYC